MPTTTRPRLFLRRLGDPRKLGQEHRGWRTVVVAACLALLVVGGVLVTSPPHGDQSLTATVPDLRELSVSGAQRLAGTAGLRVEVAEGDGTGLVRRQEPRPGAVVDLAEEGDLVLVWTRGHRTP